MIHEYALEPGLLKQWASDTRDYAEFLREYGLGTPRLISSFPKKKRSKLQSYFLAQAPSDENPMQLKRYVEMVHQLLDALVYRDGFECESSDWVKIIEQENDRAAFYSVLTLNEISVQNNLTPAKMYAPDSLWNHERQKSISRTYTSLSAVLHNQLRLATKKVAIIDAYAWNARAISTIQSLINEVFSGRVSSVIPEIQIFYKEKIGTNNSTSSSPAATHVRDEIIAGLSEPYRHVSIAVFELRQKGNGDVFHNRCVLTEHAGISLGHGIDLSNDEEHTDEANLMEKPIYDKYWDQFIENNCFEILSKAT